MKKTLLFAALVTLISTSALAKVYECVDSRGNHSYSEVPNGKNCRTPSNLGVNFSTSSSYKPALTDNIESASNKSDTAVSNAKSNQAAIATARQNLAEAQKALEEGKKVRMGNERNYARYLERIKGLEDTVKTRQQELDNVMKNNSAQQ